MRKLYLRIYLAVLASLAAFAVVTAIAWRSLDDVGPPHRAVEVMATIAQNALPPATASPAEQQAALERLSASLRADVALFAPDRTTLAVVGEPLPPPDPQRERGSWGRPWRHGPVWTLRLPDGRWLVARPPHDRRRPPFPLIVTLVLVALAVGVGAYPVVRRLTARLERLQAGVESLGAGDLSARVKVEGRDEVARLADSFNRAAARIESLVGAHKALLANASHELRTPLARIRMAVELMRGGVDPKRKKQVEDDIAELDGLIDEILLASRLDAVKQPDVEDHVDLLALATEEAARYDDADVHGEPVAVRGDPRLLRRLIRNLLENARRHGAPPVEVHVARAGAAAELSVCDHGPGVPDSEREAVFRPFYRFTQDGTSTGTGLGLSLVRQIARRHGGDARYVGRDAGKSCFAVTLDLNGGVTAAR